MPPRRHPPPKLAVLRERWLSRGEAADAVKAGVITGRCLLLIPCEEVSGAESAVQLVSDSGPPGKSDRKCTCGLFTVSKTKRDKGPQGFFLQSKVQNNKDRMRPKGRKQ